VSFFSSCIDNRERTPNEKKGCSILLKNKVETLSRGRIKEAKENFKRNENRMNVSTMAF
jgi:hypothetical protein